MGIGDSPTRAPLGGGRFLGQESCLRGYDGGAERRWLHWPAEHCPSTGSGRTGGRQAQDERVGAPAPPTLLWVPAFAGTTIVARLLWVGDGSWGRNPAFAGTTVVLSGGGFTGRRSTVPVSGTGQALRQAQDERVGAPAPPTPLWVPAFAGTTIVARLLWVGTVPAFGGRTVVLSGGGIIGRLSTVLRQAQDERLGAPAPPTPLWVPAFAGTTTIWARNIRLFKGLLGGKRVCHGHLCFSAGRGPPS